MLGALVLIYVGTRRVLATGFGSVLRAIRDNADRVPYLGYNPFWYKLLAYIMAAQIAAFGGLIYPLLRGFVAPHLFGFEVSTKAVVMSLVGGVGTLLGPLIGSVIITFVESFVGSYTERHLIVLGVIFIVFVLFLPDGLCGLAQRLFASRQKAGAMIRVTDLNKAFGALKAVNELSFEAAAHRITSIIGPNGAGKSTAFNLIAGTLRPDSGRVELAERDVTGHTPYMLTRLGIARSFQITNLFFGLSVLENIRLACQSLEERSRYLVRLDRLIAPRARAGEIIEQFGLADNADELVGNLSHGDQRRVEIAICMALEPKLLMLDEPTQGMSPGETAEIDALIKSLAGRVTVLLIEHDIDLVMSLSDHVIVMHQGRKLFEGRPEQVRASPLVREAYLGVDHAAA